MIKRLYIMAMALCLSIAAIANNTITVSNAEGRYGDVVTLAVSLASGDPVSAVQLEIPLDENLNYVPGSATLNAERSDGHSISATTDQGRLRIIVYSLALKTLKGTEGELATFQLKLGREPAVYNLIPEVTLTAADGNKLDCSATMGTVRIIAPKIQLGTQSLDFGTIPVGESYSRILSISNVGTEDMNVSSITADSEDFSFSPAQIIISAGTSKDVEVTYTPSHKGDTNSIATITSDAMNGEQTVELSARSYTVNELHLPTLQGRYEEDLDVVLHMKNIEPIAAIQLGLALPDELAYVAGSAISLTSTHQAQGTVVGNELRLMLYSIADTTIEPGESDVMRFRIKLLGKSGTYTVKPLNTVMGNSDLQNVCSDTQELQITITSPKIEVASAFDFGSISILSPDTISYRVKNVGQEALSLSGVSFADDAFRCLNAMPLEIMPNQYVDLQLEYTPTAEGDFSSTMDLYANDPEHQMITVTLHGHAYAPVFITLQGDVDTSQKVVNVDALLENHSPVSAFQMDLHCPDGISLNTATASNTQRTAEHTLQCVSLGDNTYRLFSYSNSGSLITGEEGSVAGFQLVAATPQALNGIVLYADNIRISDIEGNDKSTQQTASLNLGETVLHGDANHDGKVDIADALYILNHYLNGSTDTGTVMNCDMNNDGVIDVTDAVEIINIIR